MRQPRLRELMARASQPGVLSFAIGLPATELLPAGALGCSAARLLGRDPAALQYAMPYAPLKSQIVELMKERGVRCSPEQVFLTAGAQQAMDLLARLLLDPGGEVMVEQTTYEGIQMAVRGLQPRWQIIATDCLSGLDVGAAAALLERGARPAFLYSIPSGHNPLGVSLDAVRRRALLALARKHALTIVEDDTYGFLYYDEAPTPPLRADDEDGIVLYLGSFSKILAPALRSGWMVVPAELIPRLSALKHGADLDTSSLGHRLVSAFLDHGALEAHLALLRREYRRRRDAMLAALEAYFPAGICWNRPAAGLFIWVELRPESDAHALLEHALVHERVAFTPGEAFAVGDARHAAHCLRLCFASLAPPLIDEGIRRLARAVTVHLG